MAENELLNKLNKIHESKTQKEIKEAFDEVAEEILNKCILVVNNKEKEISYRITEIEFYYNDECCNNYHPDPYTHRHYRQRLFGEWYFHKKGRGGLDITFGKGKNCNVFGGILIRAIAKNNKNKTKEKDNYSEGPCKVIEKILKVINLKEHKNKLKKEIEGKCVFNTNNILHLAKKDQYSQNEITVYSSPRVGLQPNRDKPEWDKYIMKNYRYFTKPSNQNNNLSEGRELIILSLLNKFTRDCIKKIFHFTTRKKTICCYLKCYNTGYKIRENKDKRKKLMLINKTYKDFGVKNRLHKNSYNI